MRVLMLAGHPGHELRIHHWVTQAQPAAVVFTRGLDQYGDSSLHLTERVLTEAGAERGPVFGRFDDREVYQLLLERNFQPWRDIVLQLADYVCEQQFEMIVGDAREGFNPTHDLCHSVRNAVVAIAERRLKRPLENWQYPLYLQAASRQTNEGDVILSLSSAALARKQQAAAPFAVVRPDIGAEFALPAHCHRSEVLCPADVRACADFVAPFYEEYGQRRVAEGKYSQCVTYREHLRPVELELAEFACKAA